MLKQLFAAALGLLIAFTAGCTPESTVAAPAAPADPSAPPARVTIQVTNLRNHSGQLIFGIFKTKDGFPNEQLKSVNWQVIKFDSDTVTFAADLPPGVYGASVLHDENGNNDMDKNLIGIPTEGYGVTNNPKPRFRAATFAESTFTLPKEGAQLTISMQYF